MRDKRVKVLYILGGPRSGSTLLGHLLGQYDRFIFAGEIRLLWQRLTRPDWQCGCSSLLSECAFWSQVLAKWSDSAVEPDKEQLRRKTLECGRWFAYPTMLATDIFPGGRKRQSKHLRHLDLLYETMATIARDAIIVDSSKKPAYASLLSRSDLLDIYVVHLVRDSRAVAYSEDRVKPDPVQDLKPSGVFRSGLRWIATNFSASVMASRNTHHYRLKYEDLAANPTSELKKLATFLGEEEDVISQHAYEPASDHVVSGNPDRHTTGPIKVSLDDRWTREQPRLKTTISTVMTFPLLYQYGYLLRDRHYESTVRVPDER